MGTCISKVDVSCKTMRQAASWYRKAAEQGDVGGQNNLGYMYEYGQGVVKDYGQAAYWYRIAAEQGDAQAQQNLRTLEAEQQQAGTKK